MFLSVLSHPVCSSLLWQPWETNTDGQTLSFLLSKYLGVDELDHMVSAALIV